MDDKAQLGWVKRQVVDLAGWWLVVSNSFLLVIMVGCALSEGFREAVGKIIGDAFDAMSRSRKASRLLGYIGYGALILQLASGVATGWVLSWAANRSKRATPRIQSSPEEQTAALDND